MTKEERDAVQAQCTSIDNIIISIERELRMLRTRLDMLTKVCKTDEKVMEGIQTQVIEFPDTHQKFIFIRKIEIDGDSIKISDWEYKGVKDEERPDE